MNQKERDKAIYILKEMIAELERDQGHSFTFDFNYPVNKEYSILRGLLSFNRRGCLITKNITLVLKPKKDKEI